MFNASAEGTYVRFMNNRGGNNQRPEALIYEVRPLDHLDLGPTLQGSKHRKL